MITHYSAQAWSTQEATLVKVQEFADPDQALGSQIVVEYQYAYGQDNFPGQFSCVGQECPQTNLYHSLSTAQANNQTIPVLVNPQKPQQSLLYRHLHLPLLLLKIGVGLFCFITGCAAVIFGVYVLYGPGRFKGSQP